MQPGEILDGRYTINERLGAGGMGEVYKATHNLLGATRVIKVVHPHISSNEDARDRFLREARAATKVQHANVATVHDFAALPDGSHYMVWEFIDGENLAQRLRSRGTLPPRQAVRIAIQALRGLDAIHRAGIIHRDISPENLMITREDEVKIIDLGVAKLEDTEAVSQTRTGIFVGKLRYASPEQLGFLPEGERIDGRADLYSLAMVLVELLTGRPPYEAKSPHEYFVLHAREAQPKTVELPANLAGGPALQVVLDKALSRDRTQRHATARELAAELEEIERSLPDEQHVPTMAVPLDGDATWRANTSRADTLRRSADTLQRPADTLHRDTVRTAVPAAPTVLTPLPAAPAQKIRKGINPAYAVAGIAVVVLTIGGVLFWPREQREPIVRFPETTTTTVAPPSSPPSTNTALLTDAQQPPPTQLGQSAIDVTGPAATETQLAAAPPATAITATAPPPQQQASAPATTPTRAPATAPRRQPEQRAAQEPPAAVRREPQPEPEPERVAAASNIGTYIDGAGDSDLNDRLLEDLRSAVQGTNRVALRAGGMQVELARALREHFPNLEFAPTADVVIRFDGTFERLGRGRKRRAAVATVTKNGRVVFRYELPDEVYRVGMSPPEAFARVMADAMEE